MPTDFDLNEPDLSSLTDHQLADWSRVVARSLADAQFEVNRRRPISYCPECGSRPREHHDWCYLGFGKAAIPRPPETDQ